MLFIRQCIDDAQAWRRGGEGLETGVGERADHRSIHPAFEVARDVGHRLASAKRDVGGRLDDVAAELPYRDLEGRTGAQRRLLEQQRDVASFERADVTPLGRSSTLHLRGQLQAALELFRSEIQDRKESGPAGHARCGSPR